MGRVEVRARSPATCAGFASFLVPKWCVKVSQRAHVCMDPAAVHGQASHPPSGMGTGSSGLPTISSQKSAQRSAVTTNPSARCGSQKRGVGRAAD